MVFDFDREPAIVRIDRWASCHRPRLENAVELKAEVVVQAGGGVLLDYVAEDRRILDLGLAARLCRLGEVALSAIGRELAVGRHAHSAPPNGFGAERQRSDSRALLISLCGGSRRPPIRPGTGRSNFGDASLLSAFSEFPRERSLQRV